MMAKNTYLVLICGILLMTIIYLAGCSEPVPDTSYTVSGVVEDEAGNGIDGITLSFSGSYGTARTDRDGRWTRSNLKGAVTITPVKTEEYYFSPTSYTVSRAESGIKFTAKTRLEAVEGTEITFLVLKNDSPEHQDWLGDRVAEFADNTGIIVEFEELDLGELMSKINQVVTGEDNAH